MFYKFITLEELMKRFNPKLSVLCTQLSDAAGSAGAFSYLYENAPPEQRQQALTIPSARVPLGLKQLVAAIAEECGSIGLPVSAKAASRLHCDLSSINTETTVFKTRCLDLLHGIEDELHSLVLFSISPDKQYLITDAYLFGGKVSAAFPSAREDIEEAGKCIAFDRWTAAVFHLSRVAELATVSIGKRVGYESSKEGFGEVLKYMDVQLEKNRKNRNESSPLFKGDIEFLSLVTVQMHAVNEAWRQRVSHLDKKYTEEEVFRIWTATKGLMQQMAEKLNEAGANA